MGAKQFWESAGRTCVTMADLAVDSQTSAMLRRVQAALRGPVQPKKAKEAYEIASQARDAMTQGDKEDAQRLLGQLQALLEAVPEAPAPKTSPADIPAEPKAAAAEAKPAGQTETPPKQKETPDQAPATQAPHRSEVRRMLMPIFNKLRSALGGERGKQAAQKALYTEEHENKEREIAEIEGKLDSLLKDRDALRDKMEAIVVKARTVDKSSFEYTRLKHEATLIKPNLDAIDASIGTLMKRAEDLAKISASYRSVLLSMQNTIDEHAMVRTSVLVDQAAEQIDQAADQDMELHKMAGRTEAVHQRVLSHAAESEPSFFDEMVSGSPAAREEEEEDPFDRMVAAGSSKAETETPARETPAEDQPAERPQSPLEL